jgi:hypothetical protein
MSDIKRALGMAWASPVARTAVQAGLAIVVASGTGFIDAAVWKTAALAAGAALFAKLQSSARG